MKDEDITPTNEMDQLEALPPTDLMNAVSAAPEDLLSMQEAIAEAHRAQVHRDVPVGAVVVSQGQIIGRGENRRELDGDPTAHAEMIAIRQAARTLGTWYLVNTTIYVTQEPCPMCAGAIVNARIARLVYGCDNPKAGAVRSLFRLVEDPRLNHRVKVERSPLAAECGALLTDFFRRLRAAGG